MPSAAVEGMEFLRTMRCGDHTHPLVRMHLKAPESPEAQLFAAFAIQDADLAETLPGFASQKRASDLCADSPGSLNCPPGSEIIRVWDTGLQRYIYCCS